MITELRLQMSVSTVYQIYCCDQFSWWPKTRRSERTTDWTEIIGLTPPHFIEVRGSRQQWNCSDGEL